MNITLKLKQYGKMAAQNLYLPAVYGIYRHRKIDPKRIIFADAHHNKRPGNMDLLIQEMQRRGYTVEELYLDYQKAPFGQVLKYMSVFMKKYASAGAVVLCDNFLPAAGCRKKKDTLVVQLWHACGALKKFGYDTADDIPANYRGNVFRGTDLVTVSAPGCVKPFSTAMRLPERCVRPLGISRTDRLFAQNYLHMQKERFLKKYPQAEGKTVVLWTPTFRGNPGQPECIDLDLQALQEKLGDKYFVTASLHPHMKKTGPSICAFSGEEMLGAVDILIADYSSIIFEYLLLDKPLVLFVPDFDQYTGKRGFYMDYTEIPGKQASTLDGLAEAVKTAGETKDSCAAKRQRFLQKYMSACDGQATGRIADAIEQHLHKIKH